MAILPGSFDFDGPFPPQTRRLRLGVVGGGRISQTQAMAARMTDRWDIVAGAFSSDPAKRRGAVRSGMSPRTAPMPIFMRWQPRKPRAPTALTR